MGSFYMESTQINYRRDETVKTVDQKLQELSETSAIDTDIAPVFKSTNTYAPGDMVYYRNKLYVFNVEHTGAWAAADVTATDVTTELSSLKSGLTNVTNQVLGLHCVYKTTRESDGDVTFTTTSNRFTGFLLITANNGKYAIYTVNRTIAGGQHILKLVGDDFTISYSDGVITITIDSNWSTATLITDEVFS